MRKIILILVGLVLTAGVYSQVPLVEYKPVIVPNRSSGSSNNEYVRQPPSYSVQPHGAMKDSYMTVTAYYYDSNTQDYKRTKIKINPIKDHFGELNLYVRGVLNNSGYSASWDSCNDLARKVNAHSDGDLLANNFEWKASSGGLMGTVYFNY